MIEVGNYEDMRLIGSVDCVYPVIIWNSPSNVRLSSLIVWMRIMTLNDGLSR